jgi:hypothetical protein
MIKLTESLLVRRVGVDREEEGVTKASGRIGPSKMSAHSFTFLVLPGDLGVWDAPPGVLIRGDSGAGGGDGGRTVDEVRGITWACLEIEDK